MREKLILVRNFLYRLFLIGFLFSVFAQVMYMLMSGPTIIEATKLLGLPPFFLTKLMISTIVSIRIFLVYVILAPALALHWTISRDKAIKD